MTAPPSPAADDKADPSGLIEEAERRLSRSAKIAIACVSLVTSVAAGAGAVYTVDNRYVHSDAYAEDRQSTAARFDQSDLRNLEGQFRTVTGQIFDLERQRTLTDRELTFLKQLKDDQRRLDKEMDGLRQHMLRQRYKGNTWSVP